MKLSDLPEPDRTFVTELWAHCFGNPDTRLGQITGDRLATIVVPLMAKLGDGPAFYKARHDEGHAALTALGVPNGAGCSDLGLESRVKLLGQRCSEYHKFIKKVAAEKIEYGHYGAGQSTALAEEAKRLV